MATLLATLAFTGIRIGEARALLESDVDLVGGWIDIRSRADWKAKTERSERRIPIHPRLLRMLKAMPPSPGPHLFTAQPSRRYPDGGHTINPRRINERLKRLAEVNGYGVGRKQQGLVLHSLRHFFKTTCINAGVPKPLVDFWLGHEDRSSMDSVYYHPQDRESKKWIEQIPFGD